MTEKRYIAKAFAAQEQQEQSEDTAAELLRKQITTWRAVHLSDPTRGLYELMGVVKQVYERDLSKRIDEYTAKQKLMANNRLTVNQADILLHTLGHPKYYRNYFAADPWSPDAKDIQSLVWSGFMEPYSSRDCDSGLQYYHVTEAGMERMREAGYTLVPPENECGEGADHEDDAE